jgi:hypothetical protein
VLTLAGKICIGIMIVFIGIIVRLCFIDFDFFWLLPVMAVPASVLYNKGIHLYVFDDLCKYRKIHILKESDIYFLAVKTPFCYLKQGSTYATMEEATDKLVKIREKLQQEKEKGKDTIVCVGKEGSI